MVSSASPRAEEAHPSLSGHLDDSLVVPGHLSPATMESSAGLADEYLRALRRLAEEGGWCRVDDIRWEV